MEDQLSRRNYRQFFSLLSFDDNPFAHTNADEEERLLDYFIPPPYFNAVFGNPKKPKSFIVFAPRGGGKSAQRRMIESKCENNNVLAITYDRFEFPSIQFAKDVTQVHHLQKIIRYCLMGILVTLYEKPDLKSNLSKYDKNIFVELSKIYFDGIDQYELSQALNSLKSLKQKIQKIFNELPMNSIQSVINNIFGKDFDFTKFPEESKKPEAAYLKYRLGLIQSIASKLEFDAIYILIDRVDEAELTGNNASATFDMLRPLLIDLELLELKGFGFKFFLWDKLESSYSEIGRTDRISQETLEWNDSMLIQMWEKRLQAYSNNKMSNLNSISDPTTPHNIDELALIFAHRSPRDMIRIGAQIITEQQESNNTSKKITQNAIYRGIEKFCSIRAKEIVSQKTLKDLKKIREMDFTIPHLANNIFKENHSTTRNRLMGWRREGAIVDIDRVDNPNPQQKTQVKLLAIEDIRIGKEILPEISIPDFLNKHYKKCPKCGASVLRDWNEMFTSTRCHDCQFDLSENEDQDDWESWKRKEQGYQSRRNRRNEKSAQLSLFGDD